MSLEDDIQQLSEQLAELRSVMCALMVAVEGLTKAAVAEVEERQAPFIEVIKPDDPAYAEGIKAFKQTSIFEPRLEHFASLKPSNNKPEDQGAYLNRFTCAICSNHYFLSCLAFTYNTDDRGSKWVCQDCADKGAF